MMGHLAVTQQNLIPSMVGGNFEEILNFCVCGYGRQGMPQCVKSTEGRLSVMGGMGCHMKC